uniref:AMP-dependent synthetase/ligase domain-containing protein n=1 Tax=Bionectria ochroleuca TaxID=29856 RepID=A0A8H7KE69_BIOOC
MKENSVTVTHLTPAMGQILVGGATARIPSLRNAFFVGDILTKKDTSKLRELAPNTTVINLYGSTETQRAVSFFEIPSKTLQPEFLEDLPDIIPVGEGMQNVQVLVVDREDKSRLCEIGEQGEIFIRSCGLSEGYLGDDETTVELNRSKFLTNWFVEPAVWREKYGEAGISSVNKGPRDRLYRTGDLGRRRPEGVLSAQDALIRKSKFAVSESSWARSTPISRATRMSVKTSPSSEETRMRSILS